MVECGDGGGPWPSVRSQQPPQSWSNGRVRICTHHHYHFIATAHTHATTTSHDMVQDSFDDNNKTNCDNINNNAAAT